MSELLPISPVQSDWLSVKISTFVLVWQLSTIHPVTGIIAWSSSSKDNVRNSPLVLMISVMERGSVIVHYQYCKLSTFAVSCDSQANFTSAPAFLLTYSAVSRVFYWATSLLSTPLNTVLILILPLISYGQAFTRLIGHLFSASGEDGLLDWCTSANFACCS